MVSVLHVTRNLEVGGAETLIHRLVTEQERGRWRAGVCCLGSPGPLGEDLLRAGYRVHALDASPGFRLATILGLRRVIASEAVDVVHAHTYSPFFFAALATLLMPHVVLIYTEHGRLYPERERLRRQLVNPLLARRADHIVSISGSTRTALAVHDNFPEDRIRVIWNGVRIAEPVQPEEVSRVRRGLGIDPGAPVLGMAARLVELKDVPMALRALRIVVEREPACRLVIAGDGPERGRLERLARETGVAASVHFLGMRPDLERLYAAFDVFLLSSRTEGISVTLLEAMARGCPAVVTGVGGNPEVVLDGRTGFVVAPGDHRTMASRILRLLRERELLRSMGRSSAERVRDCFSFERMLASYEALYTEAARRGGRVRCAG